MRLHLQTPTRLYIEEVSPVQLDELEACLTYRDKKVQFAIKKLKSNRHFIHRYGMDVYMAELNKLKEKEKVCLLNKDQDGRYWVLSGMKTYLENKYNIKATVGFTYPDARNLPWSTKPTRTPYPYQQKAKENLLEAFHARVEMATGIGKSFCLLNLVKDLGLKTLIMAPSTSIAKQLHKEFLAHFGKKYVGAYFDGSKDFKKLFVIGNGQSLTRVELDSPAGKALSQVQVFVADESHQCPAATMASVCLNLAQNASYRFFFSATQMRNDGLDLLLDAITGPTVYTMSVKEGVDQGYLAKPVFKMVTTRSNLKQAGDDASKLTREHLYYNPLVLKQAATIINQSVEKLGHQVLVLIDEVKQFTMLLPYLKHKVQFAHGTLGSNKDLVPAEYHESDPNELVDAFNANEFPILVGTSCIATGTDIRSVKTMVYLRGGKSEIEVTQGAGRCTRKVPGKTACTIIDFDVENVETLHRHAVARKKIYDNIYGPVEIINWP